MSNDPASSRPKAHEFVESIRHPAASDDEPEPQVLIKSRPLRLLFFCTFSAGLFAAAISQILNLWDVIAIEVNARIIGTAVIVNVSVLLFILIWQWMESGSEIS